MADDQASVPVPAPAPNAAPQQDAFQPLSAHLAAPPSNAVGQAASAVSPSAPSVPQPEPWKSAIDQLQNSMLQQMQTMFGAFAAQMRPAAPPVAAPPPAMPPVDPVLDTYQHLPDEMRAHYQALTAQRSSWAQHVNSTDAEMASRAKTTIDRVDREIAQYRYFAQQNRQNAELQKRLDDLTKAPQQQQESAQMYERAAANITADAVAKGLPALGAAMAAGKLDGKAIVAMIPTGLSQDQFGQMLDIVGVALDTGFRMAGAQQPSAPPTAPFTPPLPPAPTAPKNPATHAPGAAAGASAGQFPDDKYYTMEEQQRIRRQTASA